MSDPYLQLISDLTRRLAAVEERVARLEAPSGEPAAALSPPPPRKAATPAPVQPPAATTAKRRPRTAPIAAPQAVPASKTPAAPASPPTAVQSREAYKAQEKASILAALMNTGWNRLKAADDLKIPRRTFYRRMKEYGLMTQPPEVQVGPKVIRAAKTAPKVKAPSKTR